MNDRIDKLLADKHFVGSHTLVSEPVSRSWRFHRRLNGRCSWAPYGFVFSYHPGRFGFWGDLDSLEITHYHAIDESLEASLHWLAFSSADYLLKKSSAKKVFSAELSANAIWGQIMERVVEDAWCYAEIIREWIDNGKPEPRPERPEELDKPFAELSCHIGGDYHRAGEDQSYWRKDLRDSLVSWLDDRDDGETAVYEIAKFVLEDSEPYECIRHDWKHGAAERLACMKFAARYILCSEFGRDFRSPHVPIERIAA